MTQAEVVTAELTTYAKCCALRSFLLRRAGEIMCYTSWNDKFAADELRTVPALVRERRPQYCGIQPAELTDAQCDELGFGCWSKENPMRLIPLWLYPFLADEMRTECIDGSSTLKKADMDNDSRFGCLAYGITPCDRIARTETPVST